MAWVVSIEAASAPALRQRGSVRVAGVQLVRHTLWCERNGEAVGHPEHRDKEERGYGGGQQDCVVTKPPVFAQWHHKAA